VAVLAHHRHANNFTGFTKRLLPPSPSLSLPLQSATQHGHTKLRQFQTTANKGSSTTTPVKVKAAQRAAEPLQPARVKQASQTHKSNNNKLQDHRQAQASPIMQQLHTHPSLQRHSVIFFLGEFSPTSYLISGLATLYIRKKEQSHRKHL